MRMDNDFLSPERTQMFLTGLGGLPAEEIRKAKSLYVRNAISDYEATVASIGAFKIMWIMFLLIPLFWPFLFVQKRMMDAGLKRSRDRIHNAISVWAISVWQDDLEGERFEINGERVRV